MTDMILSKNSDGVYDISLDENGDFATTKGLDTAIILSVLCDARADPSEMPDQFRRRGWIGGEIGSKLWLYEQSRLNNSTVIGCKDAVVSGLKWMTDKGYAESFDVVASQEGGVVGLAMTLTASSGEAYREFFELWSNTGE